MTSLKKEYKIYLDTLRDSGRVNMYGAIPYIIKQFKVSRDKAEEILNAYFDQK